MKLEDITNVLSLFFVLMFFYVSSQSSCSRGWFGHQCKYKCRCENTRCDVNGLCIQPYTCQGGWFGPACQYADLAYRKSHVTKLTDGNDTTCNITNAGDRITIPFNESIEFTWLRVHVTDQGRNVAVRETAWQASEYVYFQGLVRYYLDANRAVDGDTEIQLDRMSCTHTRDTVSWAVTLSRQRSVYKYVIYNRGDGFEMESFDSMNRSVFRYKDGATVSQQIYTVFHSPLPVLKVVITTTHRDKILSLCEVELYGDSICDPQHYGRDCEHSCRCANNETCFLSTGGCTSGWAAGFFGDSCWGACPAGKLGNYCNLTCSDNCQPFQNENTSACDNNAVCQTQCEAGFIGSSCTAECSIGKFGMNCTESCSPNCEPSGQANVSSCDTENGTCLMGCQSGFYGAMCGDECANETYGPECGQSCSKNCAPSSKGNSSSCNHISGMCLNGCKSGFTGSYCTEETMDISSFTAYIVALCLLLALIFFLLICLCRKKFAEAKSDDTNPSVAEDNQGPEPVKHVEYSSGRVSRSEAFSDNETAASSV